VRAGPAIVAGMLLGAGPVHADDENVYRLEYQAPPECPTAEAFAGQIALRVERGHAAKGPVLARLMSVRIEPGYVGRLRFLDRSARLVVRELEAASCQELVDALVLVTALAIDAQTPAQLGPEPDVALPQYYLVQQSEPPSARPAQLSQSAPEGTRPHRRSREVLGLSAIGDSFSSPELAWGAEAAAGLSYQDPGISWRLRLRYAQSPEVQARGERAHFALLAFGADLCPLSIAIGPVRSALCGDVMIGALRGQGEASARVVDPRTAWRSWTGIGALSRFEIFVGRHVAWDVQLEALESLARPRYRFTNPDLPVYRPPAIGFSAGMGLEFWLE
jgi:hypothetical protein